MDKSLTFARNTGLFVIAMLAILAAGLGIGIVAEAVSWQEFTDWMTKATLSAIIVTLAVGVVGAIVGVAEKK